MFQNIQALNFKKLIDKNTTLVIDTDTLCYDAASVADRRYVVVTDKATGDSYEFDTKTDFQGRSRKSLSEDCWLYTHNQELVKSGLKEKSVDDFDIEQKQELKLNKATAIKILDKSIENIKKHLGVENVLLLTGGGETFRHKFKLPVQYKSSRSEVLKPLLLHDLKSYIASKPYALKVTDGLEADDVLSIYGFKGYQDYKSTGKFSYIVSTVDKDAYQTPSLLFNYSKTELNFNYPFPFLIHSVDKDVGDLVYDTKKGVKGYGFKWLMFQMTYGDDGDCYSPYKYIEGISSGQKKIFDLLKDCNDVKSCVNAVAKQYKEWWPEFVHYKDWEGDEVKLPWEDYANMLFLCAYMRRATKDTLDFKTLYERFGEVS